MRDNVVLRKFHRYMRGLEGGNRPKNAAKDHARVMGRMLYEVDRDIADVSLLWQEHSMSRIRNNVFEGNHLADTPKQPQTLISYTTSMKLFYNFLLSRSAVFAEDLTLTIEDRQLIQGAITRVGMWGSGFSEASAARRTERRRIDQQELMGGDDLKEIVTGKKSRDIAEYFLNLDPVQGRAMAVPQLCKLRDYLMLRLIVESGQRPGAVGNLTLQEYETGRERVEDGDTVYVTETTQHKTSLQGPACLLWSTELRTMGDLYKSIIRPRCAVEGSGALPRKAGVIHERTAFFIGFDGGWMDGSHVSNRVSRLAKEIHPTMDARFSGARLRKSVVSLHRKQENPQISSATLASQMSHAEATADRHYNIEDRTTKVAAMATFVKGIIHGKTEKKKEEVEEEEEEEEDEGLKVQEEEEKRMMIDTVLEEEEMHEGMVEEEVEKEKEEKVQEKEERIKEKVATEEETMERVVAQKRKERKEERREEKKDEQQVEQHEKRQKLTSGEKKGLMRLFIPQLTKGSVPRSSEIRIALRENLQLSHITVETVKQYLAPKVVTQQSPETKTAPTTSTVASSSTASKSRATFSREETHLVRKATQNLPDEAVATAIIKAIRRSQECQDANLLLRYNAQQLRDKFKSIRRSTARRHERH